MQKPVRRARHHRTTLHRTCGTGGWQRRQQTHRQATALFRSGCLTILLCRARGTRGRNSPVHFCRRRSFDGLKVDRLILFDGVGSTDHSQAAGSGLKHTRSTGSGLASSTPPNSWDHLPARRRTKHREQGLSSRRMAFLREARSHSAPRSPSPRGFSASYGKEGSSVAFLGPLG
jgi:hypothetical protein